MLEEDAAPELPPEEPPELPPEGPPELLLLPDDFSPLPLPALLDELLLPAWLLLEVPPAPAFDELLRSPPDAPPPEPGELSDDPPEEVLLVPLLPPSPPLSELLLDLTAQVTRKRALATTRVGKYRGERREENIVRG